MPHHFPFILTVPVPHELLHFYCYSSGLDPAGPLFTNNVDAGLTTESGRFVDVIHTDGLVFGLMNQLGHVDFYVNGGAYQPGCYSRTFRVLGEYKPWTKHGRNMDETWTFHGQLASSLAAQRLRQGGFILPTPSSAACAATRCASRAGSQH